MDSAHLENEVLHVKSGNAEINFAPPMVSLIRQALATPPVQPPIEPPVQPPVEPPVHLPLRLSKSGKTLVIDFDVMSDVVRYDITITRGN